MTANPFHDLHWWADFLKTDEVIQNEMLTRAMCRLQGLTFDEYEAFALFFMDKGGFQHSSGYDGPFDKRYLYPLYIGFGITVNQTPGRLELQTEHCLSFFEDKTVLITRADPAIDWNRMYIEVLDDIHENYPHIPAWHESVRINHYLEDLSDLDDWD